MTAVRIRSAVAVLISGVWLIGGFAGTAHAHGTWSPPGEPQRPPVHAHRGPFAVLHQGGPFSVLRPAR